MQPVDIQALAERLGFPIPEPYRASIAEAFMWLLDQAALVMAADIDSAPGTETEFIP